MIKNKFVEKYSMNNSNDWVCILKYHMKYIQIFYAAMLLFVFIYIYMKICEIFNGLWW